MPLQPKDGYGYGGGFEGNGYGGGGGGNMGGGRGGPRGGGGPKGINTKKRLAKKKNKITICNQRTVGPSFLLLKKIHSVVSTIRNDFNYVCKAVSSFLVYILPPLAFHDLCFTLFCYAVLPPH